MNPQTPTTHSPSLSAADALGALQQAWAQQQTPLAPAPPATPEPAAELRQSFLDLREVPQISFDDARAAFPMLAPGFPAEWKEQLRQLRNRLCTAQGELAGENENLQILAFTNMCGARPRYGTATNLALALSSLQDTRVLVADANLYCPTLHNALHIPPGPGLCEATRSNRAALPACFRRVAGSQIYLLPTGDALANAMDPIDLRGFHLLLHSLRAQFDWILLDGPGFDTTADAMGVSMAADGVIMMIEQERDSFREVARALGQVHGRRLLGAVMY